MSDKKTKKIDRGWDWVPTWVYSLFCSIEQTAEFEFILLVAYAYSHFRGAVGRIRKEFISILLSLSLFWRTWFWEEMESYLKKFFSVNFHEEIITFPNFLVNWKVSKHHWRSNQHISSFWPDLFLCFTDLFVLWFVLYHNWVTTRGHHSSCNSFWRDNKILTTK